MKKSILSLLLLTLCLAGEASAQLNTKFTKTYSAKAKAKTETVKTLAKGSLGKAPKLKKEPKVKAPGENGAGNLWTRMRDNHIMDKLDVAFTLGTTGLGLELKTPLTEWAALRLGFDGIPKFNLPLGFDVATYSGEEGGSNNFDHVKDIMFELTGQEIDENIRMNAKPNIYNLKLLVDIYPFKADRRWHVTAGVFFGSHVIGRAVNSKEETNSLVAMNLYNRIFDRLAGSDGQDPIVGDIYVSQETYEKMMRYGRVGIHLGDFKDGTPYYMEPQPNGTVSATAYANSVKPYLGIGFDSPVDRSRRLKVGFDAGALFWGGSPDIILADGVNMTTQLKDICGKVGDYVRFIKAFKVYPAVSFRLSYTFF